MTENMFHLTLPGIEADISYCFFNSLTDQPILLHVHPCFELVFVRESEGSKFIINPPMYEHVSEPISADREIASLLFTPSPTSDDIIGSTLAEIKIPTEIYDTFGGGERIMAINRALSDSRFGAKEEAAAQLRLLFIELARAVYPSVDLPQRAAPQTLDDERIARLEQFFNISFRDAKCSKLMLAESLGVSERHLSRILHNIYGKNFYSILLETRMTFAKAMMDRGKSIKETAEAVGYTSLRTFIRAYNAYFGHKTGKSIPKQDTPKEN